MASSDITADSPSVPISVPLSNSGDFILSSIHSSSPNIMLGAGASGNPSTAGSIPMSRTISMNSQPFPSSASTGTPSFQIPPDLTYQAPVATTQNQPTSLDSTIFSTNANTESILQMMNNGAPPVASVIPTSGQTQPISLFTGVSPPTFGGQTFDQNALNSFLGSSSQTASTLSGGNSSTTPLAPSSVEQQQQQPMLNNKPSTEYPPFKKQKSQDDAGDWSPYENSQLSEAVEELGQDWEMVSQRVLNRSAQECEAQWNDAIQPKKGKWDEDEDAALLTAYKSVYDQEVATNNGQAPNTGSVLLWYKIAGFIAGRSAGQCMARYNETLDPSVKYVYCLL